MNAPMPQTVVDRVLLFMHTERTGSIQLHFKDGRLMGCEVRESVRFDRESDRDADRKANRLDDNASTGHDSPK